jgi:hypothetical protein
MIEDTSIGAINISLDSHYRYMSGLLMGIGIGFWASIRHIERKKSQFRLLSGIVILGGLGRLYGAVIIGIPGKAMCFGLVMELLVVPCLLLWQIRVARSPS